MSATSWKRPTSRSHVYFVESGLVSVVGAAAPNHRIEIGMVGYEGMTGLSIVLGGDRSANETLVQSAGSALRISTRSLREMLDASRSLTASLLRYVIVFMVQGSQTALANGRGRLDQRLARWLLMWDDRTPARRSHRNPRLSCPAAGRPPAGRHRRPARAGRQRPDPLDARRGPHPRSRGPGAGRQRLLRHPGSRICPVNRRREQPRRDPCVHLDHPENSIEPLEGAMQRELTPVEGRGGVISGRIVTVLVISSVGAVVAMAAVWAIVGWPT